MYRATSLIERIRDQRVNHYTTPSPYQTVPFSVENTKRITEESCKTSDCETIRTHYTVFDAVVIRGQDGEWCVVIVN